VIANQYVRLIRGRRWLKSSTADARRGTNAARVAKLVPWRAGTRANRSAGRASAAADRIPRNSQDGRNSDRKKL